MHACTTLHGVDYFLDVYDGTADINWYKRPGGCKSICLPPGWDEDVVRFEVGQDTITAHLHGTSYQEFVTVFVAYSTGMYDGPGFLGMLGQQFSSPPTLFCAADAYSQLLASIPGTSKDARNQVHAQVVHPALTPGVEDIRVQPGLFQVFSMHLRQSQSLRKWHLWPVPLASGSRHTQQCPALPWYKRV